MATEADKTQDTATPQLKIVDGDTTQTPIKTEDTNKEKIFSQSELDVIVATRVSKEKGKYPGYDDYRTKAEENSKLTEKITGLEKENQISLDTLRKVYDGFTADLDEDKISLIPEQLSLAEKITYMSKNKSTFVKVPNIVTPVAETEPKGRFIFAHIRYFFS